MFELIERLLLCAYSRGLKFLNGIGELIDFVLLRDNVKGITSRLLCVNQRVHTFVDVRKFLILHDRFMGSNEQNDSLWTTFDEKLLALCDVIRYLNLDMILSFIV